MAMAMITDPSWLLWVTNEPTTHWTLWPGAQPLRMAGDDFDNGQHLQSATWWFCPFSACTTKISTKINQPVVGSTCSHFFSKSFSRCENHKWFTPIITDVYTDEFLPMWFCIGSQRQRHCKENGSVGITSLHFVSECMSFTQWMYNLYWDSDSDEMSWAQTKFYLAASICHSGRACRHLGNLWRQACRSFSGHSGSAHRICQNAMLPGWGSCEVGIVEKHRCLLVGNPRLAHRLRPQQYSACRGSWWLVPRWPFNLRCLKNAVQLLIVDTLVIMNHYQIYRVCVFGPFKQRYVACFCSCPLAIFLGLNFCYSSLECLLDCANGASQFNLHGRVIEGEVERKTGQTFVSEPQFTIGIRLRCEESPYQDPYRCSRMYSKCIHCEDVQWPG